ncbi:hypothetical protein GCM10009848_14070 [Micromonospora lupini]
MPYVPPCPRVARVIAEEVLRHGGEFAATASRLHAIFRERIPDSPACESPAATATYVRWSRTDLGTFGVAVHRHSPTPTRREYVFRLVAIPGETAPPAREDRP